MQITIALPNGNKAQLRKFRDKNGFESFDTYVESDLIPFVLAHCPEVAQIRCSISGWLVGSYDSEEIIATIRQGVVATGMRRFHPILDSFTTAQFIDAVETLLDHVATRTLISSRPSPVFNGAIGKNAIDSAPRTRQLISLLNHLIYDGGNFRSKHSDSFDIIDRLRSSAKLADLIRAEWDGSFDSEADNANHYQDLYSALVELDAKWQISALRFTAKESESLAQIKSATKFDVNRVRQFVWQLVVMRDKHAELNLSSSWTLQAYRDMAALGYDSAARVIASKSNLVKGEVAGDSKRYADRNADGTKKEKPKAAATPKASKSTNPNVNMFANMFASNGLGDFK